MSGERLCESWFRGQDCCHAREEYSRMPTHRIVRGLPSRYRIGPNTLFPGRERNGYAKHGLPGKIADAIFQEFFVAVGRFNEYPGRAISLDSPVHRPEGLASTGRILRKVPEKIEFLTVQSRCGKSEKDRGRT